MRRGRLSAGIAGVVTAAIMATMTASPARALPAPASTLCTTFVGCLLAGKSNFGYATVYLTSFWNMTAGHNCTNYIAYRLTHDRLVARPPETAVAASWGGAARKAGVVVDDVPVVGDVAWWDSYVWPAGERGHVAYVEAVNDDGSIEVSEDNLSGDFGWRRVVRTSGGWPSGFIHYPDSDGSPLGTFISVASPSVGTIDFWGSSSDPDAAGGAREYLVTLGGPRTQYGVETFRFSSPYFRFHWIRPVRSRGATPMYLYALNTPGTAGDDALLGRRTVTIRQNSTVTASLADATITKKTKPRVRVQLAQAGAGGTVEVLRGTTVLKRATLRAGERLTLVLPRQKKGKHVLRVRYRGSAAYAASARNVTLRVR